MNTRTIASACAKCNASPPRKHDYKPPLGMASSANPIETLETSVSDLLKKSLGDPWSLLMIQTLVWCFRRWAIHYLTSDEVATSMREFLWESHLDLVDQFSPPDLREFALIWLNPENVGDRADTLEELNAVFVNIVDAFDHALQTEDDDEQNALADFIDIRLTAIMDTVLAEKQQYRIYPTADESPDSFSTLKIYQIMETILDKFVRSKEPAAVPQSQLQQQQKEAATPAPTVAAALNRRRTLRAHRKSVAASTRKNRRS